MNNHISIQKIKKNGGKRKERKIILRCGTVTIKNISTEGNLEKNIDDKLMRKQCRNTFVGLFLKEDHLFSKEPEKDNYVEGEHKQ
jgi:hypothetical protein